MDVKQEYRLNELEHKLKQLPLRRQLAEQNFKDKIAQLDAEEKQLQAKLAKAKAPEGNE